MRAQTETNIRLPACAMDALKRITESRGISRDEAVRQIVDEHILEQEVREPDDRLTHISTVLRYPAPPQSRRDKRVDIPLRLRLTSKVIERARSVSLQLPGQSRRAHRDYQARSLTDTVITAIAVRESFTDEFLNDLMPLLRHAAAVGFWKLAVALTSTDAENSILDEAERIRSAVGLSYEPTVVERRLLLVAEALDNEVSWHSSARFFAAAALAREFLNVDRGPAMQRVFYEQGEEWSELRLDLRHSRDKAAYFREIPDWHDWSGRGATAVWRAKRRVGFQDFEDWLTSPAIEPVERARAVEPPGWQVRKPAAWNALALPFEGQLPARVTDWIAASRVMIFPVQNRRVVWPLSRGHDAPTPIPGLEPLVAIAQNLRATTITEFVEALLIEWGAYGDTPDEADSSRASPNLLLPVDRAFDFGYVTADERRNAMADARAHMTEVLPNDPFTDDHIVQKAIFTLNPRFQLLVTRSRKRRAVKPMWVWPGGSIAAEIGTSTSPEAIGWLATCAHWMAKRELQHAMQQAWHDGFDHRPASHWHPNAGPSDIV